MAKSRKLEIGKKVGLGFIETVIHICVYIVVIALFIKAATLGYDFAYQVFGDPAMSPYDDTEIVFEVPEGAVMSEVAQQLQDEGLIKYALAFRIKARLSNAEGNLVPGKYSLNKSMTGDEILVLLTTQVQTEDNALIGEDAYGQIVYETETETETGEGAPEGSGGE